MTVVHVIIAKSKPSAGPNVAGFVAGVKAAYEKVASVKSVRVGESINSAEQNKGFNFTLLLEFEDEAVSWSGDEQRLRALTIHTGPQEIPRAPRD